MKFPIIITRTQPGADEQAAFLQAHGFSHIVNPVLTITHHVIPTEREADALLVTSTHALPAARLYANLPLFCVGEATAKKATALGLNVVAYASDAVSLSAVMQTKLLPGRKIFYLSGDVTRHNMQSLLCGHTVTRHIAYTAEPQPLLPATIEAIRNSDLFGVILMSPRTAKLWLQALAIHQLEHKQHIWFCLSPDIAKLHPSHVLTAVAREPTQDSILSLVADYHWQPA